MQTNSGRLTLYSSSNPVYEDQLLYLFIPFTRLSLSDQKKPFKCAKNLGKFYRTFHKTKDMDPHWLYADPDQDSR